MIRLDGTSLTLESLWDIATFRTPVSLSAASRGRVRKARALVESWLKTGETIYGVTTGFGEFANTRISPDKIEELQENLIVSHAAGCGPPLPPSIVRAMMALRINALARGHSGIRLETLEMLVRMLNAGIIPVIPSQGSVGASGDLVQLAHLVLAMMGRGRVWDVRPKKIESGARTAGTKSAQPHSIPLEKITSMGTRPSGEVLRTFGMSPVRLTAKEGLALINGTQMMTAYLALASLRAQRLMRQADIIAAISVEALRGSDTAFDNRIQSLRPYRGQSTVAKNLRGLMKGSNLRESHRFDDPRVQDAYSIRCIPQVHGASRDALDYVSSVATVELNSVNDNPLLFPDAKEHLEGGNFHGQPIALAADFLCIALSEMANVSERRTERLVNGSLSGLPRFLTNHGGLHSGLMIAQYTAASLVSENKVLSHPASVDSIPTSANQEDHNSMGSVGAQKLWRVLENTETVLAIEYLCACQALDFARTIASEKPLSAGKGTESAYETLRSVVPFLDTDRVLHDDIERARALVKSGVVLSALKRVKVSVE